jgi:dimethylhistidine N-methyltransferase
VITHTSTSSTHAAQFAADVQYYLTLEPRQLPSRYFYDELGSALFDAICALPWYGITRAETRLLAAHGRAVFAAVPGLTTIIELGPGSGAKLATLVEVGRHLTERLDLRLVDISPSALELAHRTLAVLPNVNVVTYADTYEAGLVQAAAETHAGRALVLFLGSNIGNFDRPGAEEFMCGVRAGLRRGDALLMGADLVKPEAQLLLAYDDPLGVTAAFNRNLLVRINRELGGNFDVCQFAHRAVWAPEASRVEMHLVSRVSQRVRIGAQGPRADSADGAANLVDITFAENESIWTESSYKYRPDELVRNLQQTGFRLLRQWIDRDDGFALTLAEAV